MLVNFENYGNFNITMYYSDDTEKDVISATGYSLKDAMNIIEIEMHENSCCINADVYDIYTGEIVAIMEREDEDFVDEDWYADEWKEDPFIECGYDPYMGCYSDDC